MKVRTRLPVGSVLLAIVLAAMIVGVTGQTRQNWDDLMKELTNDYNRDIRPVSDWGSAIDVYLGIYLQSIIDVNEKEGTLKTQMTLQILWSDSFLAWNETLYGDIYAVLLRQRNMWLPDLVVANSVKSQTQLGYDNLQLRVISSGYIWWEPSDVFETACDMDITYYPFDTQVCSIVFKTSASGVAEIKVNVDKSNPIDLSDYSDNGLWTLVNSSAENLGAQNENDQSFSVTKIQFKLQLQRRRAYYVMNIILPIIFLSLTSSITFALPCEAGEKTSLAITILLAYAVYLTIVTDSMPATSVQISVMTVYLVMQLALTAASVVLNVVILHLHHRHPSRPVTGCFAAFILVLRKGLCLGPPTDHDDDVDHDMELDDANNGNDQKQGNLNGGVGTIFGTRSAAVAPTPDKKAPRKSERKGRSRRRKVSGQCVAETLDMLMLVIFTCVSILLTIICLAIMSVGADRQLAETALG